MISDSEIYLKKDGQTFSLSMKRIIPSIVEIEHAWSDYYHQMSKTFYKKKELSHLFDKYYYQSIDFKRKLYDLQRKVSSENISLEANIQEKIQKLKESIENLNKAISPKSLIPFNELLGSNFKHEHSTLEFYNKIQTPEFEAHNDFREIQIRRLERIKKIEGNYL